MNFESQRKIRDMLRNKPFVSLHELEEMFPDVSSMTLRRDIDYFEKQSEAIKVAAAPFHEVYNVMHGGEVFAQNERASSGEAKNCRRCHQNDRNGKIGFS